MNKRGVKSIRDIIEDAEAIKEYSVAVLYGKIGHAQLLSRESFDRPDKQELSSNLLDPAPHIRKVIATDTRVVDIADLPSKVNTSRFGAGGLLQAVASSIFARVYDESQENVWKKGLMLDMPFRLKLKLEPGDQDRQKWEDVYYWNTGSSQECCLWWNGDIFLAYTIGPDEPNILLLGPKTRDVLIDLFKDSEAFEGWCIGPSPIHLDIVIPILSEAKLKQYLPEVDTVAFNGYGIKFEDRLIFPILAKSEDDVPALVHEAARRVFGRLRPSMYLFCQGMKQRSLLLNQEALLGNKFNGLTTQLLEIQEVPIYRFWYKQRMRKSLSRLHLEIHTALVKEHELRVSLEDTRAFVASQAKADKVLSLLKDYFLEHLAEVERIDRGSVSSILAHVDQQLNRYSAVDVQLVSAIIGAIIAVGLMYAGAYLNSLFGP